MKFLVKKKNLHSLGLFACSAFKKGELICEIRGKQKSSPDKYTIQIADKLHLEPDSPLKYMNHHCYPNALIQGTSLFAGKDIEPGDEICFNYNSTEEELSNPFICDCCNKWIKGKKYTENSLLSTSGKS